MAYKYGSYKQWVRRSVEIFHPGLRDVAEKMQLKDEVRKTLFYLGRKAKSSDGPLLEFLEKHFQEVFDKKISEGWSPEDASNWVKDRTQFYYGGDPLHPGVGFVDAYYAGGEKR